MTADNFLLLALLLTAAVHDMRLRRIPNWLVLAGLIAGIAWNIYAGTPWRALQGFAAGMALYLPLYMLRARGAGDVKLLAAAGAIIGAYDCLWLFLLTALAAAAMALALVIAKKRAGPTFFNVGWMLHQLAHGRAPHSGNPELDVHRVDGLRMPHAPAVAVGAVLLLLIFRSR